MYFVKAFSVPVKREFVSLCYTSGKHSFQVSTGTSEELQRL